MFLNPTKQPAVLTHGAGKKTDNKLLLKGISFKQLRYSKLYASFFFLFVHALVEDNSWFSVFNSNSTVNAS